MAQRTADTDRQRDRASVAERNRGDLLLARRRRRHVEAGQPGDRDRNRKWAPHDPMPGAHQRPNLERAHDLHPPHRLYPANAFLQQRPRPRPVVRVGAVDRRQQPGRTGARAGSADFMHDRRPHDRPTRRPGARHRPLPRRIARLSRPRIRPQTGHQPGLAVLDRHDAPNRVLRAGRSARPGRRGGPDSRLAVRCRGRRDRYPTARRLAAAGGHV